MNNQIEIFRNEEFGEVRTIQQNNEVWFVGKDIATILGYKNISDALKKHVDNEDKGIAKCDTLGGIQNMTIINESGLYSLILSSKLPQAKEFKRWVTSEVLPSIRKNGGYIVGQDNMTNEELLAKALLLTQNIIKEKEQKILNLSEQNKELIISNEEMKPKATYYDMILQNKSLINTTQIAKDYGYSAMRFNQLLHNFKIQYKQGKTWVLYSKYQNEGYTASKTYDIVDNKGEIHISLNTCWTQKGRVFLYNFLKENGILPLIEKEEF